MAVAQTLSQQPVFLNRGTNPAKPRTLITYVEALRLNNLFRELIYELLWRN
jgi:hypothetical protein